MKKIVTLIMTALLPLCLLAQQRTELRGNVINSLTGEPVAGATVTLRGAAQIQTTDNNGEFHFTSVPAGNDIVAITSPNIISREFQVRIEVDAATLLRDIKVVVVAASENLALAGVIDASLVDDDSDGGNTQEISSMVILSNDIYLNTAGYQLSQFRFKIRGYDSNYEEKLINGVPFNDQFRGVFNNSSIGALNDMTRNGDVNIYNSHSPFTFGSIGGSENINMRAGSYARGSKVTLSYTNRNYYLRGMATYSTGLQDNGWAFTASLGGRWSDEGNIEGTFYKNFAYGLSLEKQWKGGKHSLSVVTYGSPVERGQQGASYQEAYDLVGDNLYNPNWGWQNGKKRNSRVVKAFDPTMIISHIWKMNDHTTLTSGFAFHYGRYGSTALNWYDGADPRPDYYRRLPGYISEIYDENTYLYYVSLWQSGNDKITQVDWDKMYQQNYEREDGKAVYMLEERRSDLQELTFNTVFNTQLSDRMKLTAGLSARNSKSIQFKTVADLMGATYINDVDKFAERDFPQENDMIQNDLNKPGRRAYKGDIFGYDYRININSANLWVQNQYTSRIVDINYGTKISYTEFWRNGKMRNGRFPDSSFGKGKTHSFVDYGVKAGALFKISGRHFITGNVSFNTQSPLPYNAYISPRITENTVSNLESEKIFSADINYIFSTPSFTGRVSVFNTNFFDQIVRKSFYHDSQRTFLNHMLTGVDKTNRGIEVGVKYKLNNNWSFDLIGTVAEYYYANNPDGVLSLENGTSEDTYEKVYIKDYYVGSTPQVAGTFAINFFHNYWFFELDINGVARNYVDIAPSRRMASNYLSLNPNNAADMDTYRKLTDQERYPSGYTLDFSVGKILYLKNRNQINFNFAFNNLLNRKNIITGGYESARVNTDFADRFQAKYYYMQGFNCYLNVSYRF